MGNVTKSNVIGRGNGTAFFVTDIPNRQIALHLS